MAERPKHILFLFVDGLGIGDDDVESNPLSRLWPHLEQINGGERWTTESKNMVQIDANLSLEGLPQSGTGQASLFTGVNCAELAGRHFGPYPHSKTKGTIAERNIFQQLLDAGIEGDELAFANAYPERFFTFVEKTGRWTVTTLCCKSSGISLRGKKEVLEGRALTADLTGKGWSRIGHDLPEISPKEAGRRLIDLAQHNTFTLFEYYLTDKAGHSLDMDRALNTLSDLDEFVSGILQGINLEEDLLIVTSDHGNIEDMSVKTHTRNPVPFVCYPKTTTNDHAMTSLLDVVPFVLGRLSGLADDSPNLLIS